MKRELQNQDIQISPFILKLAELLEVPLKPC